MSEIDTKTIDTKATDSKTQQRWMWALLVLITLTGLGLRGYTLGTRSLWMDEVRQVTAYFSSNIFIAMHKAASQQQPPLDNIIGYLLMLVLPFNETIVRLPAMIFGTLVIPLSFIVVRAYLGSLAAFLSALLITVSPFLVKYSQEARPYSVYFFFLLLVLWQLRKVAEHANAKNWRILFWLTFAFLMSRGMAPVSQIAALFLITLIAIPAPLFRRELFKSLCKVALAFLPFFAYISVKSKKYLTVNSAGTNPRFETWYQPIETLFSKTYPLVYDHLCTPLLWLALIALVFLFLERKRNPWAWWFGLFTLIEPILHMYIFHFSVRLDMHGPSARYFFYTQFLLFPLATYALVRMFTLLANYTLHWLSFGALVPVLYFTLFYAQKLPSYYAGDPKTDYRGAGQYLQTLYQPGADLILYESFNSFGEWVPLFFGDGLYIDKPIEQYDYLGIVEKIKSTRETSGRVILFYHGELPQPSSTGWVRKSFHGLTVIHREGTATTRFNELQSLLQELLKVYPQDSARVRVLLGLANLLCQTQPQQSTALLAEARQITSGIDLAGDCYLEQVTETVTE